jgi:hypothetical protein
VVLGTRVARTRSLAWQSIAALALTACVGTVGAPEQGSGALPGAAGPATGPALPSTSTAVPATAGDGALGTPTAQAQAGAAAPAAAGACGSGRAPLRRLTRFELNNTLRDLLGDTSQAARALPSEELGNGFGNDADTQSVSSVLAEQYSKLAETVALRATETPAAMAKLDACAASLTATTETSCARTILDKLGTRAFRRPLAAAEGDELQALYSAARAEASFEVSLATAIEALLQAPEFLYRIELGQVDQADSAGKRRPSGDEMATRLSFLFWGTLPDDALRLAAQSGELSTSAGVMSQARRMLEDPRSREVIRFFFDNLLPISSLPQLVRDPMQFAGWSAQIGALLHEETQTFLEYEIFSGSGTWPGVLTAPYTFVNDALAEFYGMPAVQGATFQKVPLDPTQRMGLLTQGSLMAGTTASNFTNPVIRGAFVARHLMCRPLKLPTDPNILAQVKPPDPYSGKTARERYSQHSRDPVCAACHVQMDPIGFTFENFDAVGRYRTTENGVTIDASGQLPGAPNPVSNAVGLAQSVAAEAEAQDCFVYHWVDFAYGRSHSAASADRCVEKQLAAAFEASGYDIKQLLLDLTQTDAFLYLPEDP